MDSSTDQSNWFVRITILLFCFLVVGMISFSYFFVDPKGQIDSGIITLLLLLLVLVLSETFDSFSLGKLISISREVKRKDKEVQKLEHQNSELLKQMISMSSNQNQSQQHTNVYGDYHAQRTATVERASEQELQLKDIDEEESNKPREYRTDWRKIESLAMDKYVSKREIHAANVIPQAKLVTQFHGTDPVSSYQPIFDGYYNDGDAEIFVEFKPRRNMHFMLRERIYVMLSKINNYRNVKGVNAHLDLVWLNLPEEEPRIDSTEPFLRDFEPAIASGLLRIDKIDFTQEEFNKCKRKA